MLYQMIDLINDTLVSIRFSVNQNVHFEVLLVKLAEQIKGQPQVIANVAEPALNCFIAKTQMYCCNVWNS